MSPARLATLPMIGLLTACISMPEPPILPTPDDTASFAAPRPERQTADGPAWWVRTLDDPTASLVEAALDSNPSIREAKQALAAAEARLALAEANLGPSASIDASITERDSDGPSVTTGQAGIGLDLPIDVSGALSDRLQAAGARLDRQRALLANQRAELARDLVVAVIDQWEARQRSALLDEQLEVAETLLRLIELRFAQGIASSVDVLQQRDQRAALRQQQPIAERDAWRAANRQRRLAGRTPGAAVSGSTSPAIEDRFALVVPQALMTTRPDLRASAAAVAAADAEFAAALADRLPTLNLSGSGVRLVVSGDYTSVLSATLAAAFSLFDSGRIRALAAERRAELAALGERHIANWLDAVFEVDDLLFERASLAERLALSAQRLASAQQLLDAAQRRYAQGVSDYLPVLAALRDLQQQQRDDLALRAELQRTRVRLHFALGDGNPPRPAASAT